MYESEKRLSTGLKLLQSYGLNTATVLFGASARENMVYLRQELEVC